MATTIVLPSLDISGTLSASTHIGTAGTFTGSLTASSLTITGTATFSGTAVFVGTAQFLSTVTFSGGVSFLGTVSFSATVAFLNATVTTLGVTGTASFAAQATFAGTATFSGTAIFLTAASISGSLSVGSLYVSGTSTLSGASRHLGALDVSATISTGAIMVATKAQMTVFPNSYLLATASGVTSTQFKLNFSNTAGGFTHYTLVAQGKGNALATNFIIFLYTDGGTTPFMTYATAAAATATASEAILVMDITQDILASGLVVAVPRYQHFVGVTTQNAQTRSATFTVSAINCIGVTMGSTTTTRTMSAASIYLTGFIGAKS